MNVELIETIAMEIENCAALGSADDAERLAMALEHMSLAARHRSVAISHRLTGTINPALSREEKSEARIAKAKAVLS